MSAAVAEGRSFVIGGVEISVRLLGLTILLALVAILLVPSLHQWWQQEAQLREVRAELEEKRAENEEMQRELDLWSDPEWIASQARERLGYVKPGETQFSVVDPGPGYTDGARVEAARDEGPARPWVENFTTLLTEADHPTDSDTTMSGGTP